MLKLCELNSISKKSGKKGYFKKQPCFSENLRKKNFHIGKLLQEQFQLSLVFNVMLSADMNILPNRR